MNPLICPKCNKTLTKLNNSYKCNNNHNFDVSKEGYVNLLLNNKVNSGDNKIMINSRYQFLINDYYLKLSNFINDKIIELSIDQCDFNILDIGCGEGYYTNKLYEKLRNKANIYGLDISKDAIKKASKTNNNITYIVSSSAQMPFYNKSIYICYSIFSPYFDTEFSRILKDDGYLITVSSGKEHLYELKKVLYDNPYLNDEVDYELNSFIKINNFELKFEISLDNPSIINLFQMTPYFYKTSKQDQEKLILKDHLKVTAHFIINIYKKRC